jgi:hypothetical protein
MPEEQVMNQVADWGGIGDQRATRVIADRRAAHPNCLEGGRMKSSRILRDLLGGRIARSALPDQGMNQRMPENDPDESNSIS